MTHRFRLRRSLLALPALILTVVYGVASFPAPTTTAAPFDGEAIVANEVIVVYEDGWLSASAAVESVGGTAVERAPGLGAERVILAPGQSLDEAISTLASIPGVAYVEPNIRYRSAALPNDLEYGQQAWYTSLIELPTAWDRQIGSPAVTIAIIDTGIDLAHPDLQGRLWVNPNEIANDERDNDSNGCVDDVNGCNFLSLSEERSAFCGYSTAPPTNKIADDAGHGTGVAGIIGAAGNNAAGMAGVEWNARLMTIKAMDCLQTGTAFDVARAVDYAVANGARIINLSLGGNTESMLLTTAIDRAAAAGVLLFASSGNVAGRPVDFPARLPSVMAISASGAQTAPDSRAPFSSWGPEVQLAAPGVNILMTAMGGGYRTSSGTSFATGLAAGVAGLVLSQNATLTGSEVRTILKASALNLPDGSTPNWDGSGRVRAAKALDRVPSTFTGQVLVDGKQAPQGTTVRAMIGNVICGEGVTTVAISGVPNYALRVDSGAVKPGCGVAGAPVRFLVGGVEASASATWQGARQELNLAVTLPEVSISLEAGWNLISLPVVPATEVLSELLAPLGDQVESALTFDAATQTFRFYVPSSPGVSTATTLRPGEGLWLRLRSPATLAIKGTPLPPAALQLVKGLNLVGLSLASPLPVRDALRSIEGRYVSVFGFTAGSSSQFLVFVPALSDAENTLKVLERGKGYWIIMDSSATLVPPIP